jgi:hypothetical protein
LRWRQNARGAHLHCRNNGIVRQRRRACLLLGSIRCTPGVSTVRLDHSRSRHDSWVSPLDRQILAGTERLHRVVAEKIERPSARGKRAAPQPQRAVSIQRARVTSGWLYSLATHAHRRGHDKRITAFATIAPNCRRPAWRQIQAGDVSKACVQQRRRQGHQSACFAVMAFQGVADLCVTMDYLIVAASSSIRCRSFQA